VNVVLLLFGDAKICSWDSTMQEKNENIFRINLQFGKNVNGHGHFSR